MELSSSNIENNLIFLEIKPYTFRLEPSKRYPKKIYCIFLKKPAPKRFIIFSQKYAKFSGSKNPEKFLIFQETGTPKKLFIFQEMELSRLPGGNFL